MEINTDKETACAECGHTIELGKDAWIVEQGVIGHRGFVPLKKLHYFCSEECLSQYFSNGQLMEIPRRIP